MHGEQTGLDDIMIRKAEANDAVCGLTLDLLGGLAWRLDLG